MELAGHLPWLLHLLLLTGVGSASLSVGASSARAAEASHEASENLSAATVQQSASPGSAAGDGVRLPQGLSGRSLSGKHDSNCTSLASSQLSNRFQVSKAASLAFLPCIAVSASARLGTCLCWGNPCSACVCSTLDYLQQVLVQPIFTRLPLQIVCEDCCPHVQPPQSFRQQSMYKGEKHWHVGKA